MAKYENVAKNCRDCPVKGKQEKPNQGHTHARSVPRSVGAIA